MTGDHSNPNGDASNSDSAASEPHRFQHALDSKGEAPESGLARQLSELARELQAEPDLAALLSHIVSATVTEVDGADWGGISLITRDRVTSEAFTDDLVRRVDAHQYEFDGPCVTALRKQVTVRCDDLSDDDRWPEFVAAASSEGVRSMLSVQLFVEGDNLGALNLYGAAPHAFDSHDESTAVALAAHAAVAMKGAQVETNLRTALLSRDIIGQAKGILMERYKLNSDEAFRLLVMASQRRHCKLRDVADELTATGELRSD